MKFRNGMGFSHILRIVAAFAVAVGIFCIGTSRAFAGPTYVGTNLPWVAYGHSFGPDGLYGYGASYNASTVQTALDDMKNKHFNMVRIFLFDDLEGVISGGYTSTIITPSSTYISNLTDFVTRANADGITVYATLFNAWDFVTYPSSYKINPATIFGNSALYATNGPVQTVARALASKQVIWDFMNEGNNMAQYYSGGWKDLAGWANMNSWISQTRAAIRASGSTGNLTISVNDPNILLYNTGTSNTAGTLNRNNLDFYDCHFYNDSGSVGISTATFGDGKPVFCGEFGPSARIWSSTGTNKTVLVDNFWSSATTNNVSGLLIWSYFDDGSGNATQGTAQLTELATKAGAGSGGVTVPPVPTGLSTGASSGQILLSWGASAGATSYKVYRSTTAGGEGTTPIASGITGTSYTNTGLTNGTRYYYKVAAVNSAGTSALSSEISAIPTGGSGTGSGPVTFTSSTPTNQQWYSQQELVATVPAGTTVTACTVTITDQLKSGDSYGNEWTNGGNWTLTHTTGSSTITYTFTMSSGTLANTQQWWAQVNSNQVHPVSGDTYTVTYTANGTQYTATGHF